MNHMDLNKIKSNPSMTSLLTVLWIPHLRIATKSSLVPFLLSPSRAQHTRGFPSHGHHSANTHHFGAVCPRLDPPSSLIYTLPVTPQLSLRSHSTLPLYFSLYSNCISTFLLDNICSQNCPWTDWIWRLLPPRQPNSLGQFLSHNHRISARFPGFPQEFASD